MKIEFEIESDSVKLDGKDQEFHRIVMTCGNEKHVVMTEVPRSKSAVLAEFAHKLKNLRSF